jgi:hypothetical protein
MRRGGAEQARLAGSRGPRKENDVAGLNRHPEIVRDHMPAGIEPDAEMVHDHRGMDRGALGEEIVSDGEEHGRVRGQRVRGLEV